MKDGKPARDRDARGRALNARPRDGLGRPLARGSEGVERVPEDLALPPLESLAQAQRLLDEGQPFHAHEVLEGTWKAAPAAERDLWQGLAQLAVGLTHLARGNPTGAATLLRRAAAHLSPYGGQLPYDVDVPGLVSFAERTVDALESRDGTLTTVGQPPRLQRRRHAQDPLDV
jgi:hypothetical protein